MLEIKSPLKYPKGTIEKLLIESYASFNKCYPEFEEENLNSFHECDSFFYENSHIGEMCSFVALHNDELVGMCCWDPREKPMASIGHNCIIPKYRGKKLGIEQMSFLVNHIKELGFTKIKVSTGVMADFVPAQKMYEAVGFKEVDRDNPKTSGKSLMHNMVYYEMQV